MAQNTGDHHHGSRDRGVRRRGHEDRSGRLSPKPFSPNEIRELAAKVLEREALDEESATGYLPLVELAKRHISDRNFDTAIEFTQRAIAADPSLPEVYNLYGALLEIKGNRLEAQKFYRAALDIDPTFKPAKANLDRTSSWHKFGKIELDPATVGVKQKKEDLDSAKGEE